MKYIKDYDNDPVIDGYDEYPFNNLSSIWNIEELTNDITGLPISLYVISPKTTKESLRIFLPDDYYNPNMVYAIRVTKTPYFMSSIKDIKIKQHDISKIFDFIKKYQKLINDIAMLKITVLDLYVDICKKHTMKKLTESLSYDFNLSLNEMTNVSKNITKLPVDIWVDTSQKWIKTAHSYRFKFVHPKTKEMISVLIPTLVIGNHSNHIRKGIINNIQLWAKWNMDLLEDIKDGIPANINLKEYIIDNIVNLNNDVPILPYTKEIAIDVVYETPTYRIIRKKNTQKYNILWNNDLMCIYWCDKINNIPRYSELHKCWVFDVVYKGVSHILLHNGQLI